MIENKDILQAKDASHGLQNEENEVEHLLDNPDIEMHQFYQTETEKEKDMKSIERKWKKNWSKSGQQLQCFLSEEKKRKERGQAEHHSAWDDPEGSQGVRNTMDHCEGKQVNRWIEFCVDSDSQ